MKCKSKTKIECGFWENGICVSGIQCPEQIDAPLTNYERIRNMSVDEMTEFFMGMAHGYDDEIWIDKDWKTKADVKQWLEGDNYELQTD